MTYYSSLSNNNSVTALLIDCLLNRNSSNRNARQVVISRASVRKHFLLTKSRGNVFGLSVNGLSASHSTLNAQNRNTLTNVIGNDLGLLSSVDLYSARAIM